jgi:hypothetical protein
MGIVNLWEEEKDEGEKFGEIFFGKDIQLKLS